MNIIADDIPLVNSVVFTNSSGGAFTYPTEQSELANGSQAYVTITSNESIQSVTIYNEGVRKNATSNIVIGSLSGNTVTVPVTINYTSISQGDEGVVIAVTKAGGATSAKYSSKTGGSTELVHFVKCNDLVPTLSDPSVTYPIVDSVQCYAIKLDTKARIVTNIINIGSIDSYTVQYSTLDGQLTFTTGLTTFEASKEVSTSQTLYNPTTSNYTIEVTRIANGRKASISTNVAIASIAPTITLSTTGRLISAPSPGQSHIITATSNQKMNSVSLQAPAGGGILGASFTCANQVPSVQA